MNERPGETLEVYVNRDIRRRATDFTIVQIGRNGNGMTVQSFAEPLVMRTRDPDDTAIVSPTFSLSYEESADWMNELWKMGVRPADRQVTSGEITALKTHISSLEGQVEFLKSLVRNQLGIIT